MHSTNDKYTLEIVIQYRLVIVNHLVLETVDDYKESNIFVIFQ